MSHNNKEYQDKFRVPPALYRTAPLWIWNDEMNEQIIRDQLQQLQHNGFGGAFVHPRPGMITTYLTDEWFELWSFSLEEAKRLGLKLYMYDENTYPSGYGGGHVTSELPDCWATGVVLRKVNASSKEHLQGSGRYYELVKAYAYTENSDGTIHLEHELTEIPKSKWEQYGDRFALFELTVPQPLPWLADFAYPDLLRPEVAERFIECTYEPYKEKFGSDFGDTIPAVFTDEPRLAARNLWQQGIESTAFSYWFNMQFQQINGYDLTDYLPHLFFERCAMESLALTSVDPLKVRYDYYHTLHQLWIQNFIAPLSNWCREAGIKFTGHFLEHSWPHAKSSPAIMSLYEYMDWPGIDMLNTYLLKEDGTNPLLLTIREAHSAANQFGKDRVICESYGAGGWDASFEDFKRIGDWLLVNGVNFISQHLTFSTIAGARKRDHPPSFDWRQPWWPEYKAFNDYQGRVSYIVSQGKAEHRILLLHPTTTAFLETAGPSHPSMLKGHIPKYPDMSAYIDLIQRLSDHQYDFDLGDEFMMERHGSVDGSTLAVGQGRYDVVLMSGCMKNMKSSTVSHLEAFLAAGGSVVSVAADRFRIDAKVNERADQLLAHPGWNNVTSWSELERALQPFAAPRVAIEGDTFPAGFHHLRKNLGNGKTLYFVVNASVRTVKGTLKLPGAHVEEWDAWTGDVMPRHYTEQSNQLHIPFELQSAQSLVFVTYAAQSQRLSLQPQVDQIASTSHKTDRLLHVESLQNPSVDVEGNNVLVLDHCHVDVGTKRYENVHVLQAQKYVYKHHGFRNNPWADAVQYKRRLIERNAEYGDGSGYDAHYQFVIADDFTTIPSMQVVVEWATYMQVTINGTLLTDKHRESAMDHRFGEWDITDYVRPGDNFVTVSARPFQLFAELESIYIRGDFAVQAVENEWQIHPQQTLQVGAWAAQGWPFYDGAARYRAPFTVKSLGERVTLHVPHWNGSVATVIINGKEAGMLGVGTRHRLDVTDVVKTGQNDMELKIIGTLKNLYGPHFDPNKPRNTAWPGMWNRRPNQNQPISVQYDLIDYGLLGPMELEVWGK